MKDVESLNQFISEENEIEQMIEEMISREEFLCTLESCVGDAELL